MSISGVQDLFGSSYVPLARAETTTTTDTSTSGTGTDAMTGTTDSGAAGDGTTASAGEFEALLKTFLPGNSGRKVSEEELFSAAVGERISTLKGAEALSKYQTNLSAAEEADKKPDGYISYEQATIKTLKGLVSDGTLTKEEGDTIYSSAFMGAQLDGNTDSLFDDRGGNGDATIAVAGLDTAIAGVKAYLAALGDKAPETLRTLETAGPTGRGQGATAAVTSGATLQSTPVGSGEVTPSGTTVDGPEGFLFKPVSNNSGTLAVLLGEAWTGNIASVMLKDSAGNLLEEGHYTGAAGTAETGREKYSFSKAGGNYGKNVTVDVTFKDGSVKSYHIPDPSQRYD